MKNSIFFRKKSDAEFHRIYQNKQPNMFNAPKIKEILRNLLKQWRNFGGIYIQNKSIQLEIYGSIFGFCLQAYQIILENLALFGFAGAFNERLGKMRQKKLRGGNVEQNKHKNKRRKKSEKWKLKMNKKVQKNGELTSKRCVNEA